MQNHYNLTVLILAAGYGRRMGEFSRLVNKSLVPYGNKPLLSHIFDKFSIGTKFIIACGHLGEQIKEYVSLVHSGKDITFVDIPNFNEVNTGPFTTIKHCAPYISKQCIVITCDTLFDFDFSNKLTHDWIAVAPSDASTSGDYCWVKRNGEDVIEIINKIKSDVAVDAFIGLAFINDIFKYISIADQNGGLEIISGFDNTLKAHTVTTWFDFGTYDKWKLLDDKTFELSLVKPNELFYVDNNRVVKFTVDKLAAKMRYDRANLNLQCMPTNLQHSGNFLAYDYVQGNTFYHYLTADTFALFLNWVTDVLWIQSTDTTDLQTIADCFYRGKTFSRLAKFREKHPQWVEANVVNGVTVKLIDEYLASIDFEYLAHTVDWKFIHGDMQFDNILFNYDQKKFTAIDWRPEFGGSQYGDIYYDLAKMLAGLYLNFKDIKANLLTLHESDGRITISDIAVSGLSEYESILRNWVIAHGFEWRKVKLLVPIIFVNMSPLHESPMDKYLISMAQIMFAALEN